MKRLKQKEGGSCQYYWHLCKSARNNVSLASAQLCHPKEGTGIGKVQQCHPHLVDTYTRNNDTINIIHRFTG